MELQVTTLDGKKAGSVTLSDAIFGLEPRADLIHRCVVWQLAKRRSGTHEVKNRADIDRTGTKMYRQKGTGSARHGSARVNLFRGGVNSTIKTVLFWAVIVVSAFLLWQVVRTGSNAQKEKEVGFSEFLSNVDQGNVRDVMFIGQEVRGKFKNDSPFHTIVPQNYPDMYKKLTEKNVPYSFKDISNGTWPSWILNLAPLVLLGALWFFMIRQMQTGGNKALSFGKSRARLLSMQQKKITFKDVAGVDEAKEELREIIEFLREAQKFQKLGGRIPRELVCGVGMLLVALVRKNCVEVRKNAAELFELAVQAIERFHRREAGLRDDAGIRRPQTRAVPSFIGQIARRQKENLARAFERLPLGRFGNQNESGARFVVAGEIIKILFLKKGFDDGHGFLAGVAEEHERPVQLGAQLFPARLIFGERLRLARLRRGNAHQQQRERYPHGPFRRGSLSHRFLRATRSLMAFANAVHCIRERAEILRLRRLEARSAGGRGARFDGGFADAEAQAFEVHLGDGHQPGIEIAADEEEQKRHGQIIFAEDGVHHRGREVNSQSHFGERHPAGALAIPRLLPRAALLPFDAVFRRAHEFRLHAEDGLQHGERVAHGNADPQGHHQRQIEERALPRLGIKHALGGQIETRNRAGGGEKQRQVNHQHLKPALIEPHDHRGEQNHGEKHHQRVADVGGEVKEGLGLHEGGARASAAHAAVFFWPSASGPWPSAPAGP